MRAAVGGGLVAVVAVTLIWWQWGLVALIALFLALGAHEVAAAGAHRGCRPEWWLVAVGGAGLLVVEYGGWCGPVLPVGLAGCTLLILAGWGWRLRRPVDGYLADAAATALIVAYLPLLATFVIAMLRTGHPVAQVATFVACIAINDSGAYIMGSLLGRHKMVPHISPAKTWEGLAGGLVWAGVAGALLGRFALQGAWWQGAVLGVVLGACGTVGDLVESAVKRDAGIKDMGKLLPGHGGVMDRLDSMLYCAPIAWALMNLWITRA